MRQIIARQMVTPQVSGPLNGKRRWLAEPAAERTPGGGRGCVSGLPLLSGGRDLQATGPGEPRRGPSGGAGWADRAVHFQITNSEIANTWSQHRKRRLSIHLRASYPNEISCCR